MKKNLFVKSVWSAVIAFTLLVLTEGVTSAATVITTFGASTTKFGSWNYDPTTSTVSGNDGSNSGSFNLSNITALNLDLSGESTTGTPADIQLNLTGLLNSGDPGLGTFSVGLYDSEGRGAFWEFSWTAFATTSTTLTSSLKNFDTDFDLSQIGDWNLTSGNTELPLNATFTKLEAIPEPSTGAMMLIGAVGLVALRRLRKV